MKITKSALKKLVVNEVASLKEDWWGRLGTAGQQRYVKKHGAAPKGKSVGGKKAKGKDDGGFDVGGPAHPNVPKGAKTSKQASDLTKKQSKSMTPDAPPTPGKTIKYSNPQKASIKINNEIGKGLDKMVKTDPLFKGLQVFSDHGVDGGEVNSLVGSDEDPDNQLGVFSYPGKDGSVKYSVELGQGSSPIWFDSKEEQDVAVKKLLSDKKVRNSMNGEGDTLYDLQDHGNSILAGKEKPSNIPDSEWEKMDADEREYHTSGQYDKDAERDDTGKDDKPYTDDDEDHGGEPEKSAYDQMGHEATELKNTMDSTEEGYNQQYIPILKNLTKKMKKGTYDRDKAAKLFMYYVDNGAKRYVKDYGGTVRDQFPKDVRMQAAKAYVEDFEDEYENKNWDFMKDHKAVDVKGTGITEMIREELTSLTEKIADSFDYSEEMAHILKKKNPRIRTQKTTWHWDYETQTGSWSWWTKDYPDLELYATYGWEGFEGIPIEIAGEPVARIRVKSSGLPKRDIILYLKEMNKFLKRFESNKKYMKYVDVGTGRY